MRSEGRLERSDSKGIIPPSNVTRLERRTGGRRAAVPSVSSAAVASLRLLHAPPTYCLPP